MLAVAGLLVWGAVWLFGWVSSILAERQSAPAPQEETETYFTGTPVACDPDALTWTFSPPSGSAGSRIDFAYTVTNEGEVPCLVDASPQNMVFSVASGDDSIWSSAHCGSSDPVPLLLGIGDSTARTRTWGGERSTTGCGSADGAVNAGTYQLTVMYGAVEVPAGKIFFQLN